MVTQHFLAFCGESSFNPVQGEGYSWAWPNEGARARAVTDAGVSNVRCETFENISSMRIGCLMKAREAESSEKDWNETIGFCHRVTVKDA